MKPFLNAPAESLSNDQPEEKRVITASHWGIVRARVRRGRLVGLDPFELDQAPSPNLAALAELPYSPSRIRFPMVREGFLHAGPASRKNRGKDPFVRVSWETALDLAASEINRIYDQYGPSAVFGRSYGWMSAGKLNAAIPLQQRLLNLRGGFIACENSYSTAAVAKILPYVIGRGDPRSTSWEVVLEKSGLVLFWGADPLVTNDVDWLTTLHQGTGFLRALKEKGTKTISINPIATDTAELLGSEWIAPRPGTDCALMLGLIHELVRSGKADLDFLKKYTVGSEIFLDYVLGLTDGVGKTPAWAESKCGVPAGRIVHLAREMASRRTMIMMGWGIQRIQYGEQSHWMGFALAAVLGQIGLPGGGIGTNYHYSSGGTPLTPAPLLGGIPSKVEPQVPPSRPWQGSRSIPVARFAECFLHPGQTIDFNGRRVTYPEVHLVMWAGGNPFAHQPDTNKLARAWGRPDTVIVTDSVWTATARRSDIVLPAATAFEHNDITNIGTYSNDGIVAMQQAIDPLWESRSDYRIFSDLSRRLGLGEAFTEGLDEMGWIRRLYDEAASEGKAKGIRFPEFNDFWEKGFLMFEPDKAGRSFVAFEAFRRDPKGHPLSTESGLIELFSRKVASYHYADCPGHPTYLEPDEGVNTRTPETPLALIACKSRHRLHSQLDGTVSHDRSGAANRESCWIHPSDARARGIRSGDIVLLKNRRGSAMASAFVTERIMPGVVVLHHGAWFASAQTEHGPVDLRGNSNTLTMDEPASSLSCGNIASSALVEVAKWEGPLPPVEVFSEP